MWHADPTIRFARSFPQTRIVGIDSSEAMLSRGTQAIESAELSSRIKLRQRLLQEHGLPLRSFNAVISNSFLHHLNDPHVLWRAIKELAVVGAPVFIMDLTRPDTDETARELVARHAQGAPQRMAEDFYHSLHAAFRPEEVRVQLDENGLNAFRLEVVSDRHMIVYGQAPNL